MNNTLREDTKEIGVCIHFVSQKSFPGTRDLSGNLIKTRKVIFYIAVISCRLNRRCY